jgi:hypothetical protein
MKKLLVLAAVCLMGAGPIPPVSSGATYRVSVQGTTGPTGATGPQGSLNPGVAFADGGAVAASTVFVWEVGHCIASSNVCATQTLHFSSGNPFCVCSDNSTTLGACATDFVDAGQVVVKTFGATDTATWMCLGLQ